MRPYQEVVERLQRIEEMLQGQALKPMSFAETAEYLGVSKSYLYRMTSEGKIPHYKPGGKKVYFEKGEVDRWLMARRVSTAEEIRAKVQQERLTGRS
jgi:excisionase family DNA binding protein